MYGMMLAGYADALSSFDPEVKALLPGKEIVSAETFQTVKGLAVSAYNDATQAVLVRKEGNVALHEELAEKSASSLAQRYVFSPVPISSN
jgi:hypothetical protein